MSTPDDTDAELPRYPGPAAPRTSGAAIVVRALRKRFGAKEAVVGIDLDVAAGSLAGLVGPNGAGKTTSLRMLLGLITPTAGAARLFGRDPMVMGRRALEGVAGFVEAPRFYPYLSAQKNLELLAALDGADAKGRIPEVLELVELTARAAHRVGGYSHGMRQRLGIAAALLRRPRLLILDEPATGLDPAGMRDMRSLIRRLADEGITVLLSSHQLPEVQELCDRVAIVDRGKVVYEGALADLRRQGGAGYRLRTTDDQRALEIARAQNGIEFATVSDHGLGFQAEEGDVAGLSLALGAAGVGILVLTPELATLEDLFFRLTDNGASETGPTSPAGAATERPDERLVEAR
jgi:ABC-2 type transport system ATP-binding protein